MCPTYACELTDTLYTDPPHCSPKHKSRRDTAHFNKTVLLSLGSISVTNGGRIPCSKQFLQVDSKRYERLSQACNFFGVIYHRSLRIPAETATNSYSYRTLKSCDFNKTLFLQLRLLCVRSIKRGGAGKYSALRRSVAAQAHACSFVVSDDQSSQTFQGQRVVSDKRQSAFLPQRTAYTNASWPGHSVECAAPGRFVLSARNPHHAVAEWVESGLAAGLRTVQHNRRLGDLLPLTSMTIAF